MVRGKKDIIEYVKRVAGKDDIESDMQAKRLVDAVFDSIVEFVCDGDTMVIKGFGTFKRVTRSARDYKTPQGKIVHAKSIDRLSFHSSGRTSDYFDKHPIGESIEIEDWYDSEDTEFVDDDFLSDIEIIDDEE